MSVHGICHLSLHESDQVENMMKTTIYPVTNLRNAKAIFSALLGVEPYMDEPYYVAFRAADHDIGLNPNGHREGMTGAINYWHVPDIRQATQAMLKAGASEHQSVKDVGGGKLIASFKDADGNVFGLIQPSAS
jgi:predicted enzyme related to lactoylglutathione lyase